MTSLRASTGPGTKCLTELAALALDAAGAGGAATVVTTVVDLVFTLKWAAVEVFAAYDVVRYDAYAKIDGTQAAIPPPNFGTQTVADQAFTTGKAITALPLPAAIGGRPPLTYSLTPTVPGLRFNASTRMLSGTPTMAGTHRMIYTVTDANNATASLSFEVVVEGGTPPPQPGGRTFRDCSDCPELVVVPAGSFRMGSPTMELGRGADEGPLRTVTIAQPFAVGIYEVTFDEWEACVADGGCGRYRPAHEGWGEGSRPVINVSWDDAKKYVSWLRDKSGRDYRLLSESEWEYVARAGTATPWNTGSTIAATQANYGHSIGRTTPVGSYAGNAFGLHDMHGNVWEWIEDCWASSYAGAPSDGSPRDATGPCDMRVVRGGSWASQANSVRSANRNWTRTDFGLNTQGFRVARSLAPQSSRVITQGGAP